MIRASDLKRGAILALEGTPYVVEQILVQAPSARGGNTLYKVRFRNVQNRQKVDQTFRGEEALQEASYDTREVQYLYRNGDLLTFMDLEDYEQFELPEEDLEELVPFLVEDMEGLTALVYEGQVLCIRPPDVVELEIIECDPSIKGASATARPKPATLTTGLIVQVPEYLAQGEVIRVDTRSKEFLSRA